MLDEIKYFYNTERGELLRSRVIKIIRTIWQPNVSLQIVGIGFIDPYINVINPHQLTLGSLINVNDDCYKLVNKLNNLPFANHSVDRILVIHSLEYLNQPDILFNELTRILKSAGKLLIIIPNKYSIWAHSRSLPYWKNKLFSLLDIYNLLSKSLFKINFHTADFFLPFEISKLTQWNFIDPEQLLAQYLSPFGGLLFIEADKLLTNENKEYCNYNFCFNLD